MDHERHGAIEADRRRDGAAPRTGGKICRSERAHGSRFTGGCDASSPAGDDLGLEQPLAVVTPAGKTQVMAEDRSHFRALRVHIGSSLSELIAPLADELWDAPGDVLSPLWCVVPTTSIRTWVDQELARNDAARSGGVTANLRSIFPRDLVVIIEQLALGNAWIDFDTEVTALRILGALKIERFEEARRIAEAIDDVVRWRPHLLEPTNRGDLPARVVEAMNALDLFEHGAHVQRQRVLDALRSGEVEGLPSRVNIFGLSDVIGGPRFLELLSALASCSEVSAFVPVPDVDVAQEILSGRPVEPVRSWGRDSFEALSLWASMDPEVIVHQEGGRADRGGVLGRLQRRLASGADEVGDTDPSVTLIGSFGNERQVEQVRDCLFESLASGVTASEILVVSPDPGAFAVALERHWNYQPHEDDGGPRLVYELTKVRPKELTNRLGASLALLRLVGNYATLEQIAQLLTMPSVATTLGLNLERREQLISRVREGKLIFGVTADQRARFDIYEQSSGPVSDDVGTWERLIDSVVASSLYPPARPDDLAADSHELPLPPLGEPVDLPGFASLQPLMRILETADELRAAPRLGRVGASMPLGAWLKLLRDWMFEIAAQGSSGDDSFERAQRRLCDALETIDGLDELDMTFEQFLELWDSLAGSRGSTRLHGRRGIVVAGLDDLAWAPYKVVCILGLDDDKLPDAGLPSPVMAQLPPSSEGRRPSGDPDVRRHSHGALLAAILSASERLIVSCNVSSEESGGEVELAIPLSELLDSIGEVTNEVDGGPLERERRSVRRHVFFDDHTRPRFDARLRRIDQERTPRLVERTTPEVGDLDIRELAQFFRDPVGQHLRRARNVLTPRSGEGATVRPRISVDDLTKFRFRERFVNEAASLGDVRGVLASVADGATFDAAFDAIAVATEPLFAELSADPDLMGDVPPIFWSTKELKETLDLFVLNRFFDEFDHETIESREDPSYLPIDLGELGTLVLATAHASNERSLVVRRHLATGAPSVLHFHPSKGEKTRAVGHVTQLLLELLALRINHPTETCRVVSYFLPTEAGVAKTSRKASSIPKGSRRLNPYFELSATPESLPAAQALDQIGVLMGVFRQGMEEMPILFRRTSEVAAFDGFAEGVGATPWGQWSKFSFTEREDIGEESNLTSRLLFPYSFKDLRRKTAFDHWVGMLQPAGHGVQWHFGADAMRPAPSSLLELHEDFRRHRDEVQSKDIDDTRADVGEAGMATSFGIGIPLLLADAADGAE